MSKILQKYINSITVMKEKILLTLSNNGSKSNVCILLFSSKWVRAINLEVCTIYQSPDTDSTCTSDLRS